MKRKKNRRGRKPEKLQKKKKTGIEKQSYFVNNPRDKGKN